MRRKKNREKNLQKHEQWIAQKTKDSMESEELKKKTSSGQEIIKNGS